MADDSEVQVKFGADISQLQTGINNAMQPVASFRERVNELNSAMKAASSGVGEATEAMGGLNFKTSGATQEFIRLGHEAMTGNFSRMPGSLLVLANRLGGLQKIMEGITPTTVAWGAALAAAAVANHELATAAEEQYQTLLATKGAMELTNQSLSFNKQQVQDNILYMREFGSISGEEADKIAIAFARAGNISDELRNKLVTIVDAWSGATGEKAEKASEDLIKMFSDPAKAVDHLASRFPALISQEDALRIKQDEVANGAEHAADLMLGIIGPKLQEFDNKYMAPAVGWWEHLKRAITAIEHPIESIDLKEQQQLPPALSSDQQAAKNRQNEQNADNAAIAEGLRLAESVKGAESEINQLYDKRAALLKDVAAAQREGETLVTTRLEQAIKDTDAKILEEKKRLNAQATAEAKKAAEERIAIARNEANTQVEIDKINLQSKKEILQAQVASGTITKQQALALDRQYADEEYNIDYQALLKELQLDDLNVAQKQAIYGKIQVLYAQHIAKMAQITLQSAQTQKTIEEQQWRQISNTVDTTFRGMLSGVLQGTETWQQAMANTFSNLAASIVESIAEVIAQWLIFEALTEGQGTWSQFVTLKTGGSGGGGFFGNILGSFDVGTSYVPSTGLAMIHQGEIILPPDISAQVRSGQASIGTAGTFGGGGGDYYNVNISAVDSQSFVNLLQTSQGQQAIVKIVNQQGRKMNSNLSPAWKS